MLETKWLTFCHSSTHSICGPQTWQVTSSIVSAVPNISLFIGALHPGGSKTWVLKPAPSLNAMCNVTPRNQPIIFAGDFSYSLWMERQAKISPILIDKTGNRWGFISTNLEIDCKVSWQQVSISFSHFPHFSMIWWFHFFIQHYDVFWYLDKFVMLSLVCKVHYNSISFWIVLGTNIIKADFEPLISAKWSLFELSMLCESKLLSVDKIILPLHGQDSAIT